jgi:hypothetical protein
VDAAAAGVVEPPRATRVAWMACRARATRLVGPWRAVGPAEGLGASQAPHPPEAVRVAKGEGGVVGSTRVCLGNCGWKSWSRLEDELRTPQVGGQ